MAVLSLCTEHILSSWVPGSSECLGQSSAIALYWLWGVLNSYKKKVGDKCYSMLYFVFSQLLVVQIFVDTRALFHMQHGSWLLVFRNATYTIRFSSGEVSVFSSNFASKLSDSVFFLMIFGWLWSLWLQICYGEASVAAHKYQVPGGSCSKSCAPKPSVGKALQSATLISWLTYKLQISLRKVLNPLRKFPLQKLVLVVSRYTAEMGIQRNVLAELSLC